MSEKCHSTSNEEEIREAEKEIDRLVAEMFNIEEEELKAVSDYLKKISL